MCFTRLAAAMTLIAATHGAVLRADEPVLNVTLVNDQGKPVSGATLGLFDWTESTTRIILGGFPPAKTVAETTSDKLGKATFPAVTAGRYHLVVNHPEHRITFFATQLDDKPRSLTLRVLPRTEVTVRDESGHPVRGVAVGANVFPFGDGSLWPLTMAFGESEERTGEDGKLVIEWEFAGRAGDPSVIIAAHRTSGRAAIAVRPTDQLRKPIELKLQPTSLVRVALDLGSAAERGPSIRWADREGRAFYTGQTTPREGQPGQFVARLRLSPGAYQMMVVKSKDEEVTLPFEVGPGSEDVDLGVIEAMPSKLARLAGKAAPELSLRWRDDAGKRIGDLRGKVVVLYFWATWCGPCLEHMPRLIDLKEKLGDKPVEWIAVHDASIQDFAELDDRLRDLEKNNWGGRRLSLHAALDRESEEDSYRGATTATYGVRFWPTIVVIDQQGRVAGAVEKDQLEPAIHKLLKE